MEWPRYWLADRWNNWLGDWSSAEDLEFKHYITLLIGKLSYMLDFKYTFVECLCLFMWSWYSALHVLHIKHSQTSPRDHFVKSDHLESEYKSQNCPVQLSYKTFISSPLVIQEVAWGRFDCISFRVFPVKPWTPKKISGMFIVPRPIRCVMKLQKITDKPQLLQQGSVMTRYETLSRPFLLWENFNFPFVSLWKSYFLPQTNFSHWIPDWPKSECKLWKFTTVQVCVTAN